MMTTCRNAAGMMALAFALVFLTAFIVPASAASETVVDFSPLLPGLIEGVLLALGGALVWLGRRGLQLLEDRTNIQLDEQMKTRVDDAIFYAVDFARARVPEASSWPVQVDVRNALVATAANYALAAVPAALDYFGVTRERLEDMIEARLAIDLNGDGLIGVRRVS
ncbi:inadl protein [Pannonibacter sp. P2PFMT1]|uniref:inadl protein n=1 Tax=Pannonibacter sp. P2PFMT1 TaxID=2003582 RepID=UPI001648512C|nr:inadl protein [Pannonibacter sp. P2PFMT1]